MSRKIKIYLAGCGILAVLAAVFLTGIFYHPGKKLEVDFLDVGQGDAILIKAPDGQNILIDGGANSRVVERLSGVLWPWDKKIDLMILTHPHDDHVTGLVNVLERFRVEKILYTGVNHDSPNYIAWLKGVRDKKIPLMIIDQPQTIKLGDNCRLEILYPLESFLNKEVENLNNTSIVAKLIYGETSFLFTGDAEEPEERELLESNYNINYEFRQNKNTIIEKDGVFVDPPKDEVSFPDKYLHNSILENPVKGLGKVSVLKIGHHGSDTSSSEEFLASVQPEMAVISVGKDNDFGHPSLRTIKKLERAGAKVFRTDESGTIKIVSDGMTVVIKK